VLAVQAKTGAYNIYVLRTAQETEHPHSKCNKLIKHPWISDTGRFSFRYPFGHSKDSYIFLNGTLVLHLMVSMI
jgi:hypothetical protein